MLNLTKIEGDLFDISRRVKEIDPRYEIYFNYKTKRFELYNGQTHTNVTVLPFDRLDDRTVRHVRKTRIERIKEIMREIDEHNENLEQSATREAKALAQDSIKEVVERTVYEENH